MKRMTLSVLVIVLALGASRVACATHTVTDTLGRVLTFEAVPQRIVLAGRGSLLLVDATYLFPGVGSRVVAVGGTNQGRGDFYPFLDPSYRDKIRFTNSVGPEAIAAVQPDLVILKSYLKGQLGDALESLGIPVLYLDLESPNTFYSDILALGALLEQPERAEFVVNWYRTRSYAIELAASAAPRPAVLVVSRSKTGEDVSFSVPPSGWLQTLVVEKAGATPVWKSVGLGNGWMKVNVEQLALWDPQYVLVVSYGAPATAAVQGLGATTVSKGTLLPFPGDFYSWDQPDSRWILGLEWEAKVLHPELFDSLDLEREVFSFYRELYGIDDETIASQILPRVVDALGGR
jgi:iron complex transport system substrate-binding protein